MSIRWKGYEKRLDDYQGELENKRRYEERFLRTNGTDTYNFSKLDLCLDEIISVASSMARDLLTEPEATAEE